MSDNNTSANVPDERRAERSLLWTMGIVVLAVAVIAIIGFLFLNHPDDVIEGQVEGTTVRISGKLPGLQSVQYTGVNRSGRPSPTVAKYVIEDLDGRIEMIIDGGFSAIGLESTIIDLSGGEPMILRPGYVTQEKMTQVIGNVDVDRTILDASSKEAPKAPGMKYRHYAPKGNLTIVEGPQEKVTACINEKLSEGHKQGLKTGVIATDETIEQYQADVKRSLGSRKNEEAIAHHLFEVLRQMDDEEVQLIFTESFAETGLGQATMNRLLKAAGHQVISL